VALVAILGVIAVVRCDFRETDNFWSVIDVVCLAFFCAELLVHVIVYGPKEYVCHHCLVPCCCGVLDCVHQTNVIGVVSN
jgi:hypothetical protein